MKESDIWRGKVLTKYFNEPFVFTVVVSVRGLVKFVTIVFKAFGGCFGLEFIVVRMHAAGSRPIGRGGRVGRGRIGARAIEVNRDRGLEEGTKTV